MRIQLSNLFVLTLFLFLTACTPSKYKTMIVGQWEPSTIELSGNKSVASSETSTLVKSSAENDQVLTEAKHAIFEQKGVTEEEMVQQTQNIVSEYQTTYYFDRGGMCSRLHDNGEGTKGTWRLKNIGNLLVLSFPESAKDITYKIYSLTSSEMVVRNTNLSKQTRITYLKK